MSSQVGAKRILVIDDEATICDIVKAVLARADYQIDVANSGQEGLRQLYVRRPDLVILDVMMPELDGWQVCQRIRAFSDIPVIMLTALDQDTNMIQGLNYGADYYLTKPFSSKVLVAYVQAALRRAELVRGKDQPVSYVDRHLAIDLDKHQTLAGNKPVRLSATEYRLLGCLLRKANRVLTFEQILRYVWGEQDPLNVSYVHVYISHLRQKLEKDPAAPEYLLNERGIGYQFRTKSA